MRIVAQVALAILLPVAAAAQQPTTTPPAPTPVVVPVPVITPVDTAAPAAAPATAAPAPAPAPAAPADGIATIRQGMTLAQVEAAWGHASTKHAVGDHMFLYYTNDCAKSCGTLDVVILENGQVTDAIVRASYHRYDGVSSSPAGRKPSFTPPPGNTP